LAKNGITGIFFMAGLTVFMVFFYNPTMDKILRSAYLLVFIMLLAPSALPAQENRERDFEIALTKGQYDIELGNFEAAARYLEQALKLKPGDQEARVLLGITYSRAGDLARAQGVLQQAVDADPQDGRARYELAIVLQKLGDQDAAKKTMARAIELSRDADLSAAGRGFLRELGEPGMTERPPLSIGGGLQYDSNVILEQDNPIAPSEKKADWLGVITLNGTLPFLTTSKRGGEAGYSFYQSLHMDLEDYNVQQHAARLAGHVSFSKTSRFDLAYSFLYSFVGAEHYSTTHRFLPRFIFSLTPASLTEVRASYESNRFFNTPVFTGLTDKNGTNASAGVAHTVMVGQKTGVAFDYTYDQDATDKDYWDYTGHKVSVNALAEAGEYKVFLGVSYYDRRYDGIPPGASEKRHDGAQELTVGVSRKAGRTVTISLTDTYTLNDSNLNLYEYQRNIVGFFAEIAL
jgi:tetratricopeptide (TPR) repeat protein